MPPPVASRHSSTRNSGTGSSKACRRAARPGCTGPHPQGAGLLVPDSVPEPQVTQGLSAQGFSFSLLLMHVRFIKVLFLLRMPAEDGCPAGTGLLAFRAQRQEKPMSKGTG